MRDLKVLKDFPVQRVPAWIASQNEIKRRKMAGIRFLTIRVGGYGGSYNDLRNNGLG